MVPNITRTATEVPQREHNQDRLRRAKSWHQHSKGARCEEDRFLFLWIAFNAAYGGGVLAADHDKAAYEYKRFYGFLRQIVRRDTDNGIERILWETYPGPIRVLLENRYAYQPFWQAVWDPDQGESWQSMFQRANRSTFRALGRRRVHRVLTEVFFRLYAIRNQLVHGGATFGTGWGRSQLRDGCYIMSSLVPAILNIMEADIRNDPDTEAWGIVDYPRINHEPDV